MMYCLLTSYNGHFRAIHQSLFCFTPASQSVAKRTASTRIVQIYVFQHELAQRTRKSDATTFIVVYDGNAQIAPNTTPNTQVVCSVSKGPLRTSYLDLMPPNKVLICTIP